MVIEHCANCANHKTSTKHVEEKYLAFARRIKQAINQQFPGLKVALKPIASRDDEKTERIRFQPGSKAYGDNIIDTHKDEPRLGAFEVTLARRTAGKLATVLLFSKLKSNVWPSVAAILKKVYDLMPKITVAVSAYDLDRGESDGLQGIRVKLVSSFRGTEAQRELDAELKGIEDSQARRLAQQRQEREQIHAAMRTIPDRPPSANPHSLKTMQSFDFLHSRASVPRL